jgi:hypothetical protein
VRRVQQYCILDLAMRLQLKRAGAYPDDTHADKTQHCSLVIYWHWRIDLDASYFAYK